MTEYIVQHCSTCQLYKNPTRGYGHLPPKQTTMIPWHNVAVDLIGPWTINTDNKTFTLQALTIIDTDTNLTEATPIHNKTSANIASKFENVWLARYPKPTRCIHDNGNEFIGVEFQNMLLKYHIKDVPTTIKNPQANAICERMHQTIGNMLRTHLYHFTPHTQQDCDELIELAIASAIFALRATIHTTLGVTPGSIVFHRDMLLDIPVIADLQALQQRRQHKINYNAQRSNKRRYEYTYQVNDLILIEIENPTKLQQRFQGPFKITQVNDNGTIIIQRAENISQTINIRRVKPYHKFS